MRCYLCGARPSPERRLRLEVLRVGGMPRLVCSRRMELVRIDGELRRRFTGRCGAAWAPAGPGLGGDDLEQVLTAMAATNPDIVQIVERPRRGRGRPRVMPDDVFARHLARLDRGAPLAEQRAVLGMSERSFRRYLRRLATPRGA